MGLAPSPPKMHSHFIPIFSANYFSLVHVNDKYMNPKGDEIETPITR